MKKEWRVPAKRGHFKPRRTCNLGDCPKELDKCCVDCNKQLTCNHVCLNTPDKCGLVYDGSNYLIGKGVL